MSTEDETRVIAGARPALTPGLRRPVVVLAAVGAVLLVVPAVLLSGHTGPSRVDGRVQRIVDASPAAVWNLIRGLDWLGDPLGRASLTVAVAGLCLIAGRRLLAVTTLLAMGLSSVLCSVLKEVVDRRIHDGFLSYPSGHTAAGTVSATIVGLLLADVLHTGRLAGTAITVALAVLGGGVMAWAQIHLTAHYPTDTLGGFGCGLLVATSVAFLADRIEQRRKAWPVPR
ncbi:phosphatase PAP2 family protein [Kribbella sp. NPDC048928]|uniref:phosphatase PAP2 family protein n=1 Tax=Kribbella sp. NPDC048928 TaxID=3364111 RepID=UPI00371F3151